MDINDARQIAGESMQYIGARYVPKFHRSSVDPDSIEWDADIPYEPLTVVSYRGDSYTSRIPVPATIGNPADNSHYWARTGQFNAAIAALQEEVAAIKIKLNKKTTNYNTVADMIADSSNINVGDYVQTMGYYTPNDGGGALYEIKASSSKWCIINLNGKVAENVSEVWYAEQFGVRHGGVTANDDILATILNSYYDYGKTLYFHKGDILVNDTVVFNRPIRIVGDDTRFVIQDASKPALNTRQSMSIYIVGFRFNTFAYLINDADAKANMDKEIFLEDIYYEAISGEPISRGLLISSKRPSSYDDNSGGAYSRYPLEILNFSGYNALMITNENISREDDETIVGATDNSAIGILDRVRGVASAAMIINTNRSALQVLNPNAVYKSTSIEDAVMCIGADGHLSIGCSNLNSDNEFAGNYDVKIYKDIPIIAMKSATTGNRVAFLLNNDANGTVGLYVYNANDNVQYESFKIQKGKVLLKVTEIAANQYNTGLKLTREDDATKFKNLVVDSDRFLRCANYDSLSVPSDAPVVQTSISGDSTNRPTLTNHAGDVGFMYFDTTLGKPIWWIGNNWVDATGATA